MTKALIILFFLNSILLSQTSRDNFLGGYDVTVDEYELGVLCSYWKAIKFTPVRSGNCDTLKWGYIATNLSTVDSICLAVFTSDEVNNLPENVMFYALALNWTPPLQGATDIAIPVTNIVTTNYLDANTNYFISMYTSASTEPHLIARGNGSTCIPNPRKVGCATSRVVPPPDGSSPGEIWNVVYANNCYGWGAYSSEGTSIIGDTATTQELLPGKYKLLQNYPNPFNPNTTIEFQLANRSNVKLTILNILGHEIELIVSDKLPTGTYSYRWEASDFPSGIYFYRLEVGKYVETNKMILMK